MKRLLLAAAAAIMLTPMAEAAPIAPGSQINITGFNILDLTSSQVTFTATKASAGAETGSFVAFGACSLCVTMTSPITFAPFTAQSVYSGTNGAVSTSFSVTSAITPAVYTNVGGVETVTIADRGTATLTGFDPTPGIWTFTGNTVNGLVGSFSAGATATAAPEPLSIAVLGAGLLGLGLARRQRS